MNDAMPLTHARNLEPIIIPATQLSVKDIQNRALQIQQLMATMMKPGVHYGVVPGCKSPSLYKPGSELLLMMFRIAVDPKVEDLSDAEHIRYRVLCRGLALDGTLVGIGVGECSTAEEKYSYRRAVCEEEFAAADPVRQRVKWGKDKNGKTYSVNQVRMNPSDLANTVLKMAKKRAQVDMCLTALGASDIFSQDMEELAEEVREHMTDGEEPHEPIKTPARKSTPPTAAGPSQPAADAAPKADDDLSLKVTGVIEFVKDNHGVTDGRKWTKYGIKVNGEWFNTLDGRIGGAAKDAKATRKPQVIAYQTTQYGKDIVSMEPAQ